MKEFIEKLIGRLEEEKKYCSYHPHTRDEAINKAKAIVNELAEEYINTSTDTSEDYRSTLERYYEKGLEDAWELARKIFTFNNNKMEEIFGVAGKRSAFDDLSPQVALAKLEAYEKANEIKVGDIVYNDDTMEEGVVTHIDNDEVFMLYDDGSCGNTYGNLTKTGKHIDIQSILQQIGE